MGRRKQKFYKTIKDLHGDDVVKTMKRFLDCRMKTARLVNKKLFLLRCRSGKLIPRNRHVKNLCDIDPLVFEKIHKRFQFNIISQEITEVHTELRNLTKDENKLMTSIMKVLPQTTYTEYFNNVEDRYKTYFNNIRDRHIRKHNLLMSDEGISNNTINSDKWLMNASNIDIPPVVKSILSLGDKFCIPVSKTEIPYDTFISDVESSLFNVECQVDRTETRNRFVNILTNFKNRSSHKEILTLKEKKLKRDIIITKRFVKQHPDLIISNADKGNVTVVMNRSEYDEKMFGLLNDTSTYTKIPNIPLSSIQKQLNAMVTSWEKEGRISASTGKKLRCYNGHHARIYGLPKIHKPNLPLRPIVSSLGTPLYHLSAFLSDALNKTVGFSRSAVKNSEDFCNKIRGINLPPNYILLSLDVVSLFTNINSRTVIRCVEDRWMEIKKNAGLKLTKIQFVDALKLVLSKCEFSFKGEFYRQTFGSPMGSPVSPAAANLVMEHIESNVLKHFDFEIPFYYRYVDDIILAVPVDKVDCLTETFNNFDQNIQFTVELENEGKLPFLDIMIQHNDDGSVSLDWYHKETWSGRYLNFESALPLVYKKNTISLLAEKVFKLSDPQFHDKNLRLLKNTLLNNSYPLKLINFVIKRVRNKFIYNISTTRTKDPEQKIVSVPYVNDLFNRTKNLLSKHNISVVSRGCDNLKNHLFTRLKDPVPKDRQTNVVYEISCECGVKYVGQTSQHLCRRIYQHKYGSSKNTQSDSSQSSLSQHLRDTKHNFEMDNVKVLAKESNYKKRSILEMIKIKKCDNNINKQDDSAYLQSTYDNIIR